MNPRTLTAQTQPVQDDAVCPDCIRCQPETRISQHPSIDGVQHRTYYGWCESCNMGYEVIQFKPPAPFDKGRWLLYKYRRTVYTAGLPIFDSWVQVNRIEQPAAFASHYAALEPNTHSSWLDDELAGDDLKGYSDTEVQIIEMMSLNLRELARLTQDVSELYDQAHGINND